MTDYALFSTVQNPANSWALSVDRQSATANTGSFTAFASASQ